MSLTVVGQIKQRMVELGMSQQELAAEAQISQSYLSMLLSNKRVLRTDILDDIARALQANVVITLRPWDVKQRDPNRQKFIQDVAKKVVEEHKEAFDLLGDQ